jgi:hypothetical protein
MKRTILFFVLLVIFTSCNKQQKPESVNTEKKKDSVKTDVVKKDTAKTSQDANDKEEKSKYETITDLKFDIKDIPEDIKYNGNIVTSASWKDANGLNYLLITETKEQRKSNDMAEKELYGYQFVIENGKTKQLWKIYDFVKDCVVDITLKYIKKSLSITDLNNDGVAESTFLYFITCRGDVSPSDLKLIMHEGENKYAIRGVSILKVKGIPEERGEMKVDASFDKAPKEFLQYAKEQWEIFKFEILE